MPLPIIKICIVTIRTFARPFNQVLTRRIKFNASGYEHDFFYWFGMKAFTFENFIEEQVNKQSASKGIPVISVDLEKVSEGAAINRGIEVFVELTLFYGLLLSIAAWDLHRRHNETKTNLERLTEVE